jgi:hypothetical protein
VAKAAAGRLNRGEYARAGTLGPVVQEAFADSDAVGLVETVDVVELSPWNKHSI